MPKYFITLVLAVTLSACSTLQNANRQSEAELYQDAVGHLDASRWEQAIDALEEIDSRFPFAPTRETHSCGPSTPIYVRATRRWPAPVPIVSCG